MKKLIILSLLLILSACGNSVPMGEQAENPGYMLGSPDAKVKIVEFSDYECPYCATFHEDAFPQIKSQYIDSGLVSFEFKDFPLPIHRNAQRASQASYCAGEQDKYWEMSALLFENQQALTLKDVQGYAEGLGLDLEPFTMCVEEQRYFDVIAANMQQGIEKGVSGTPSIFINDVMITGARPFEDFKSIIDQML